MDSGTTREAWEAGIDQEVTWWRRYLAGAGLDWPDEFRFRFAPDAPLQPHVARVLPGTGDDAAPRILDCAAGPATSLGKTLEGRRLAIVAVDALADRYAALLAEIGLAPPVPTLPGEAERLDEQFAEGSFDLVYMRFALEHCYDPRAALRQKVRAARPGAVVMVEHYRDETQTAFEGLRQWELRPEPADLVVANASGGFRVSEAVPDASVEVEYSPAWLTVVFHKPPTESDQPEEAR